MTPSEHLNKFRGIYDGHMGIEPMAKLSMGNQIFIEPFFHYLICFASRLVWAADKQTSSGRIPKRRVTDYSHMDR